MFGDGDVCGLVEEGVLDVGDFLLDGFLYFLLG